ncbi:MAG TPA: hypothetical protein VI589_02200 [Vicinamibacteria bacterium]
MLLALVTLLAAPPARTFGEERMLLDRRVETLRRLLPDGPTPQADSAVLKELADQARLARVEISARPPLEAGPRGETPVELQALGRFADVDRFFRLAALHHRLLDVESMTLSATPEDVVKLVTVVRFPFRPARAPLPAPPDGTRRSTPGVPKAQADAFVRDQSLVLAKSEQVAALRRTKRNPRLFLAEIAAITRDRPVVLSHASWSDEFVIRGLTVGEGPARALESRFEKGFFRVTDFLMARHAACRRFEVKGRCPVAGIEADLPLPAEDPFHQDDSPCRSDRDDPGRAFSVKAPAPKATTGQGQLTLRLRDVDMADVFRVLHLLTGQGFLVDGDVVGRVTLDLSKLTLEEALLALEKGGLEVQDAGALRRVSLSRVPPVKSVAGAGGPAANFALKRADVRDMLAAMTDLDPSLAALGPEGHLGRASLWAKDVPLLDLRAALLDGVGLKERLEEGRRIVERATGAEERLVPMAAAATERRLIVEPRDMAVLELELAGVASAGTTWLAFAYSPTGALNSYRAGDRLADGVLKSVESADIVVETDEGPLRLPVGLPAK